MAKKKSKTQKYKKNVKKKAKKILKNTATLNLKETIKLSQGTESNTQNIEKQKKPKQTSISKPKKALESSKKQNTTQKKEKNIKKDSIALPKLKKGVNKKKQKKSLISRLLYDLRMNIHIIFNALLIITFIIMLIGIIRIEVFSSGTIIYISLIILFLMAIAISYNRYISGKVFTIILSIGMMFSIYQMQYTYDFIRNLNSSVYEYKTYYVVAFDNNQNKSIYNINNKKVGLLKDNCINIERKLNTKLDKVNYIEYSDINKLFNDFYNQEFRAILVNENQYKYLQNNIQSTKNVKILYEFKVNAKK